MQDDVIYRQQAINKMRKLQRWNVVRGYNKNEGFLYDDVMYLLDNLSPARIERKKGQWIDDGKGLYMCSSCGKVWAHWRAIVVPRNQMCKELRYCPMCGADMRGDEE